MDGDFVITVRTRRGDGFGAEPGPTRFLVVPDGQLPAQSHVVRRRDWVEQVMSAAETRVDPVSGKPAGDMLVFVHGYNNDQAVVMERHRQLRRVLSAGGFDGTVVSFDWPSSDSSINYLEDRSDAKQTALRLVTDCILLFSRYQLADCQVNVHLLAHSTGAYVVREAFDDADDRPQMAQHNWTVSQALFIGADISRSSMEAGSSKSSSLVRHCVRITNYWNPFDSVLKLSNIKRVGVAPRLGRVGLPDKAPSNAVDVDCGAYWESEVDKDPAKHTGDPAHSWHFGDLQITRDWISTIAGDIDRHRIPTRRLVDGRLVLASGS
jgi:esterase/lipase superfamily enzyme